MPAEALAKAGEHEHRQAHRTSRRDVGSKTALELGYKSLYDYCIKHLNLSEGAVPARIHVANVLRRFPQLLVALSESRVSLTVAALLAPHLNEDNVDELIGDCTGKTRRETEEYLVALEPKPVFEPSIRKRPSQPAQPAHVEPPREVSAPSPPPAVETPKCSPPILQPARPEIYNFRFSAGRAFKDKFERLAEVVGIENAQKHMAEILEKALDIALEKKDPKKKLERRRKRQRGAVASSRSNEMGKKDEPAQSRYVASEVSERVHERGSYRINACFLDPMERDARRGRVSKSTMPPRSDLSQQLRVHSSDFVPSTQSITGRTCLRAGVHPAQD
ncbi:MAG: hypothetical protein E2P02_24815 [Acidobacteria bacterium]|nr:MAG: hypothetical protein E2P02_24815 [Acidobacteriota bacterium]